MTKPSKKCHKKSDFLTKPQTDAIAKLLSGYPIRSAAKEANVSERTIYRWMKTPLFAKELRSQRRLRYDGGMSRILGSVEIAVNALQKGLKDGKLTDQIAIASKFLELAMKHQSTADLEERIATLEDAQRERIAELESELAALEDSQFLDEQTEETYDDEID
jgi:DNA-binding transcriptional MerR regulator